MASTRNVQFVAAPPQAVWDAFMDPDQLVQWLPPAEMTGEIHAFDGRVGGGYRMSLRYPPDAAHTPGKTAEHEDQVIVRFTELTAPRRLVETVTFVTDDPALKGEMTMTATLTPKDGGTEVVLVFEGLPPGLRPEDNEEGGRLSLAQLAARFA